MAAVNKGLNWTGDEVNRTSRRNTAAAFKAYWKSFSDRIPRLPPAEAAWLQGEMKAGMERQIAVLERKEFALWSLAQTAEGCADIYDRLSRVDEISVNWEAYLWVKSLNCYTSGDKTLRLLAKASLSNGKYDGPFNIQMFDMWLDYTINKVVRNVLLVE